VKIDALHVAAYEFPLQEPEADGTLTWDSTVMVVVGVSAGGRRGLGYTYGSAASGAVVADTLRDVVVGSDPMDVPGTWTAMVRAIRNLGRPGVVSHAISAVDCALWDLKARLLEVPLVDLLGTVRDEVPLYGSGGFVSLSEPQLERQLLEWVRDRGFPRVKIKIGEDWGRREGRDLERVAFARSVVGPDVELYVDANGGYTRKQAVRVARQLAGAGVTWFEEPVSSDDLRGLREVRDLVDVEVAAGEYGYDVAYFVRMLDAGAVDCVQVDVTRCGGITEFLRIAGLVAAHGLEASAHCAPAISVAPCAAIPNLRHLEYFADHERIEELAFDGVLDPKGGVLRPDRGRPGWGLELKTEDIERYRRR
jgi:L-alanine-DL-glutamate epimerase-like enolase superfamily enzyme